MTKLTVSGSAGVGKTTLAKGLAERLNVDLIEEHYDGFFDDYGQFIKPPAKLRRRIFEVLDSKHGFEGESGEFVSDRCPVDLFNLWLSRGFAKYQEETRELQRRCREYLKKYDAIIVLPWGQLTLRQLDKATEKRRRVMNPWVQFHNHSTITGLLCQWIHLSRLIPIPAGVHNHHARIEYLLEKLHRQNVGWRAERDGV